MLTDLSAFLSLSTPLLTEADGAEPTTTGSLKMLMVVLAVLRMSAWNLRLGPHAMILVGGKMVLRIRSFSAKNIFRQQHSVSAHLMVNSILVQ
jgi:hypothetical protein